MKRIIMFVLLFTALKVAGQTTGYLRFDTVKIMKQNGTCELYIINKTKDSLGILTNVGGGLTRFIKSKVLDDSTVVIGLDTLVIPGATGGGSTTLNNVGTGFAWVTTPNGSIRRFNPTYGLTADSSTSGTISLKIDTSSTNHVVTQSDLNDAIATARGDTISHKDVAYVETTGSDATGRLNNPARPFATINGALDALPSTGGKIKIGIGEFLTPDTAKIKSNVWFAGSGMPHYDDVNVVGGLFNVGTTAITKMLGGTILHGTFSIPFNRNNVDMSDLGVDNGSAWVNANNGGTALEGILYAQKYGAGGNSADGNHLLQTSATPRTGIDVRNVSVLIKSPTDAVHGMLFENMINPNVDNVYTCYGFAGIIIKTIGGVYTNLHAMGHNDAGIYLKANDYSYCYGVTINGFEIKSVGSYDGGGMHINTNDAASPGLYECVVSNGTIIQTTYGVKSTASAVIDGLNITNVKAVLSQGIGFNFPVLYYSIISNCYARACGGDGFNLNNAGSGKGAFINNCVSASNGGDGFEVDGTFRVNLENVYTENNTGYGIRSVGSNCYVGLHTELNNTAGATTGTLNTNLIVSNGGTGNQTFTPYAVIAGGTTSTGALQQVSGVGTSGQVLTSNGASALPTWQNASSGGTLQDAITAGATLSSPNTIAAGGNAQTFTGTQSSAAAYNIANTGNGEALSATTTGSGAALSTANSGTGAGAAISSNSGHGINVTSTSGTLFRGIVNPSSTNTDVVTFRTIRQTTGTAAANMSQTWSQDLEDDAGNNISAVQHKSVWTSAAGGATSAEYQLWTVGSGTLAQRFTIKPSGQVQFNVGYGSNTHTGTPVSSAQFDASGNVIEGPLVAAGTFTPTLTAVTNTSSPLLDGARYTRIGNIVTFSLRFSVTTSSGSSASSIRVTLPVASSFSNINQAAGTCSGLLGRVESDATNDELIVAWTSGAGGTETIVVTGQYTIL